MGRKKIHCYDQTTFARRICLLQEQHGYTDQEVMAGVVDEYGNKLINDAQVYGSYKSGKRTPRDFLLFLQAFAKFYDVTSDYLLELDEYPKPQFKSIQEATGFSVDAIRNLMSIQENYPSVMKMIDALLSHSTDAGIAFLINLYTRIFDDYKDKKVDDAESSYDLEKMQSRFLRTQCAYNYISSVVMDYLADDFDIQLQQQEAESEFFSSTTEQIISQTDTPVIANLSEDIPDDMSPESKRIGPTI